MYVGKGKSVVENYLTSPTQYLISNDTVIAFTQKDALRSLPIGFTDQNDLLITIIQKLRLIHLMLV
jgi:hypothetical protein